MSIRLTAIKPTKPVLDSRNIRTRIDRELRDLASEVVNKIAQYPPQEETPYVRTGQLGRHWKMVPRETGRIDIINDVVTSIVRRRTKRGAIRTYRVSPRAYAAYVQGPTSTDPGQARIMAAKGWERIDDVASEVFDKHQGVVVKVLTGG